MPRKQTSQPHPSQTPLRIRVPYHPASGSESRGDSSLASGPLASGEPREGEKNVCRGIGSRVAGRAVMGETGRLGMGGCSVGGATPLRWGCVCRRCVGANWWGRNDFGEKYLWVL